MIPLREISPLPVAFGVVLLIVAVILVVWLAGKPQPERYDEEKLSHAFSRMGIESKYRSIGDEVDRLTAEIDNPRDHFERLNRRKALREGMPEADYEAALAANRKARNDDLIRQRVALLEERKQLKAQLDRPPPERGIGEWISDHSIILSVIPFTLLGFYVLRVGFAPQLPENNPLNLTDSNRRGVLVGLACFLFALTIFVFGLRLFVGP